MPKTQNEFVRRVLDVLKVTGSGQPVQAEDSETVISVMEPEFARLAAENVYYVPDSNAIDDAAFLALANIVANVLAPSYGGEFSDALRVVNEAQLRRLRPVPSSYPTLAADYF